MLKKQRVSPNPFVYDDTNGVGGDIIDYSGTTMVYLVRHALLNCTISLENRNIWYAWIVNVNEHFAVVVGHADHP